MLSLLKNMTHTIRSNLFAISVLGTRGQAVSLLPTVCIEAADLYDARLSVNAQDRSNNLQVRCDYLI